MKAGSEEELKAKVAGRVAKVRKVPVTTDTIWNFVRGQIKTNLSASVAATSGTPGVDMTLCAHTMYGHGAEGESVEPPSE